MIGVITKIKLLKEQNIRWLQPCQQCLLRAQSGKLIQRHLLTWWRCMFFTLVVWCQPHMAVSQPLTAPPSSSKSYGFAADSLPFVETVSPAIRLLVIEGKDVNLAVLLIPYYTGPMSNDEKIDTYYCSNQKPDPRLNKCLNISEFIQAFGTYKNIMCEAFPNRRHKLDLYEREIVNMASRYPGAGLYDYHKQFLAKAALYLKNTNWKLDWSKRDSQLYSNIFTN